MPDSLRDCLQRDYGLATTGLTFLPIGHDSAAWVFRADTNAAPYFIKLRHAIVNDAGLLVPRYLARQGVQALVAPLETVDGRLWTSVGRYAVIAYPYVSPLTGMSHGMSDEQWREYGRALREVHDTDVPAVLRDVLRVDGFAPDGAETVRSLEAHVAERTFVEQPRELIATFWREHRDVMARLLETAESLASRLALVASTFVLCHADIHTNNVLVSDDGKRVWIVDWDETMLAPRERDLMFLVGGIGPGFVTSEQENLFFEGYGTVEIDPIALAYYRYSWAISDIASYGAQVFLRADLGAADVGDAVDRFQSLFAAGSIVQIALGSPVASDL
jgi:spectinomycin phosphotransferase